MDNKEFGKHLEERTLKFGVRIIKLSAKLPDTPEGKTVRYQITKAGTSGGANYREANRARSRADFYNKIKIAESETSETLYWLTIISFLQWVEEKDLRPLMIEADELLAIFTSISKNARPHKSNSKL